MITASVIADSVNPSGDRLVTFELTYPRYIHPQMMTHRMFSRNVSSSRAIPIKTMIERVAEDTAMPTVWTKNGRGMQGHGELDEKEQSEARIVWLSAAACAMQHAEKLNQLGVHKQHANRLLEPFMHITTLLSATEFDNFFALRLHDAAQPEIYELASEMLDAMNKSESKLTYAYWWHLPYVTDDELHDFEDHTLLYVSAARCARVSYLTHGANPKMDIDADVALAQRLAKNGHWSPFEHQAMAISTPARVGNFVGWIQQRYFLDTQSFQ